MNRLSNKKAYLVDFDGTITTRDLSSELPGHFDRARFDAVQKLYRDRDIPIRRWLQENAELLPPHKGTLLALSFEWARIRSGFADFLTAADLEKAPVVIASDGFGFYIEPILERFKLVDRVTKIYCNQTGFVDGKISLKTPHAHKTCRVCGNCKAAHVVKLKEEGFTVVYIGDGSNDRFGASWADFVFARDELAEACRENGFNYRQWDTFYDILEIELKGPIVRSGTPLCAPLGDGIFT